MQRTIVGGGGHPSYRYASETYQEPLNKIHQLKYGGSIPYIVHFDLRFRFESCVTPLLYVKKKGGNQIADTLLHFIKDSQTRAVLHGLIAENSFRCDKLLEAIDRTNFTRCRKSNESNV